MLQVGKFYQSQMPHVRLDELMSVLLVPTKLLNVETA